MYTTSVVDLELPGPLSLVVTRSYSTASLDHGVGLGPGWSHSFAWSVEETRTAIRVHEPAAAPTETAKLVAEGSVLLPCGRLHRTASGYVLETEGNTLYFGEHSGRCHWLTRITDANGNALQLVYREGKLDHLVDSVGRVVRVGRRSTGQISAFEVKNARDQGRWVAFRTYSYDRSGDLVAATDGEGFTMRYAYDDAHRMIRRTEAGGLVAEFRYDRAGRCVETWCHRDGNDALDAEVPKLLDDGVTRARGFLHVKLDYGDGTTEVTTSRSKRSVDGNGFHKADKIVYAGGVNTYHYDAVGNVVEYADALGQTYKLERDVDGRLLATTDPLGARVEYGYDARGRVIEIVDALGQVTRYTRDDRGNVTSIDDDAGNVVRLAYDARGQLTEGVLPTGGLTRLAHDELGNRVAVTEPDGATRRIRHDGLGRVLAFEDERGGLTSYSYDGCGRVTSVRSPSGSTRSFTYDPDGNLARVTDADGRTTELRWGGFHVVSEVVRPDGRIVRYRYDREQDLLRIVNEVGEEHLLLRSGEGRIVEERTFDGRNIRYRHDVTGQITRIIRGDQATDFEYDAVGRLLARTHADDTSELFAYDLAGRLVRSASSEATCLFEYDARGNVVREALTHAGRTTVNEKAFDGLGKVVRQTGPGGAVDVVRDVVGRPTELAYGDVTPMAFSYDASGHETARSLPLGGRIESETSLDGLLSSLTVLGPMTAPRGTPGEPDWVGPNRARATVAEALTWSPAGNLLAIDDLVQGARTEVTRDVNGRVAARHTPSRAELYGYSATGDVLDPSAPRRYGAGGRPLACSGTSYAYDTAGRVIEKCSDGPAGDRRWTFTWRDNGLLGGVQTPDGESIVFAYDAFARRVMKRCERGDETRVTRYAWDGDVLVHEIKETARAGGDPIVEERTFITLPGGSLPVAQQLTQEGVKGAFEHFLYAANGSPKALLRGDGSLIRALDPALYGRLDGEGAGATPLRALGQYEDEETGLFYNRHRFYDPDTGTYLSPEPLGIGGSLKAYAYVENRPLDFVDPDALAITTLTPTDGAPITAVSGQAQSTGLSDYRPPDPQTGQKMHPAVTAALPPNNARPAGSGGAPEKCGEPLALSRHLYQWEKDNKPKRCNPPDKDWQKNLGSALDKVKSIGTKDGNDKDMAACPNCGQTIPRLWALAGKDPPNGVYKGGVENPSAGWDPTKNQGQNPNPNPSLNPDPKQVGSFNDANGAPVQPGAFTHTPDAGWAKQ
jgi:RHS repeat-associated protein